jgi:hypothetical protein
VSCVWGRGARVRFARWSHLPATTALALALVVSSPALLVAQRFTCEEASAVLIAAEVPRLDRFSAASTMMGCGTMAPGVIATALRRAKPNSTADTVLTIVAMQTFDRRLADSIRAMALDSSQSIARRTTYLQLLTTYALPGTVVNTEAIGHESLPVLHHHILWVTEASRPFGTRLILKEDRARIVATIAEMGRQDPDDGLRRLAARVAPELERLAEESDANGLFKRTWP